MNPSVDIGMPSVYEHLVFAQEGDFLKNSVIKSGWMGVTIDCQLPCLA